MAVINGSNVANTLNGTYFADDIFGLQGNDVINGGYGADSLYGDREVWYYDPPVQGGADKIYGGFNDE